MSSCLTREPIRSLLDRLYAETVRTDPEHRAAARARGIHDDSQPGFYEAMHDAFMPVTPDFGRLLYTLARARRPTTTVEFGTSFGVSAVFLAAALRDEGRGRLVTSELDARKAERARRHLAEAELADLVDVRVGDALETLRGLPLGSVDMVFLDGAKALYLPVLRLLEPALAASCVVATDNVDMPGARSFLEHVVDERNGFVRASIATRALGADHAHEVLVRV